MIWKSHFLTLHTDPHITSDIEREYSDFLVQGNEYGNKRELPN
jgi:hypothetical protein